MDVAVERAQGGDIDCSDNIGESFVSGFERNLAEAGEEGGECFAASRGGEDEGVVSGERVG
jgi:hypothetical protein